MKRVVKMLSLCDSADKTDMRLLYSRGHEWCPIDADSISAQSPAPFLLFAAVQVRVLWRNALLNKNVLVFALSNLPKMSVRKHSREIRHPRNLILLLLEFSEAG